MPRRAVGHSGRDALRPGGQRRNRQLQRRRGSSARHRHHIGRRGRRRPRRPPLRAALDARARDRASEADLFAVNEERKIETEEVDAVTPPPRARVTDTAAETFERKRDYLAGFLSGEKPDEPTSGPGGDLQASVVEVLKSIYDPEIPVDIYELGLIYDVDISEDGDATVTMTLTTPHCPVAESMPQEVELRVLSVPGIRDAVVNLVWDPPWDPSKMSDEARLELGML